MDGAFVERQKKILTLLYNTYQVDPDEEYYKLGSKYDIESNAEHYTVSLFKIQQMNVIENRIFWN